MLEEVPFQVRDARTNEDLTRSILLQIIMEREADGEPMFSEQVLVNIIRSYGDSLQGMMASYLERSLNLFLEQQARVQDQVKTVMGSDPLSMMREITERNLSIWQEMQEGLLRAAAPPPSRWVGRLSRQAACVRQRGLAGNLHRFPAAGDGRRRALLTNP